MYGVNIFFWYVTQKIQGDVLFPLYSKDLLLFYEIFREAFVYFV